MTQTQKYLVWKDAEDLTSDQLRWLVSNENPNNPFRNLVGNDHVVLRLRRLAYRALGLKSHCANTNNIALFGGAGLGKTTIARAYADLLGLPFVELEAKSLRNTQDVFDGIAKVLAKPVYGVDLTLRPKPDDENSYVCPPCVVFIDEVHNLCNAAQQGLLTATEKKTHTLSVAEGVKMNTQLICWVIATTDRGLLFDAFDTRFTKFTLKPYSLDEMALIVHKQNEDVPLDVCKLVAKYAGRVTREALDFMTEVRVMRDYEECDWAEAVEKTRVEQGIDEFGMDRQRLTILKTLGQRGPSSLSGLAQAVGVKEEELTKFILWPLKEYRDDQPALISVSHRHFITEAGLKELERRGIPHKGKSALPKSAA